MKDYQKELQAVGDLLRGSDDAGSLREALSQALSIIGDMAEELNRLRKDHDELDYCVGDIQDELDDIEDDLDELWGLDDEDGDWDDALNFDPDEDGGAHSSPPDNITPIDSWNKGKE